MLHIIERVLFPRKTAKVLFYFFILLFSSKKGQRSRPNHYIRSLICVAHHYEQDFSVKNSKEILIEFLPKLDGPIKAKFSIEKAKKGKFN